jgi:protein tyrosine/serine phosphatase/predicted nucleotidyltransferase
MLQKKLIEKFNSLFKANSNINSTILIGSFGRNTPKANSDIDYQILVNKRFSQEQFLNQIQTQFSNDFKHFVYLKQKNKWCFYLTENFIVTKVFVCNELSELNKYFLGSEITEPKNAIVFDKTNSVESHLIKQIENKNKEFKKEQKRKIDTIIIDFQNRFESFSNAHSKSDGYKFNVLYSHAVNAVVKMVYLCEGGTEHDYMPPNFLTDYSYNLKLGIEDLGTMDMRVANTHKRKLLDLFKKYLPISINKFNLKIDDVSIVNFLENIYVRDFFWNFRDVSKFNSKLKKGIIYRSSALCLCKNEPSVESNLQSKNIETIVDLRADRELKDINYDEEQKDNYKIIHAPFDPWNQSIEFQNMHNTGTNAEIAYHFFSIECKPSIKLVVEAVINSKGAIDIHCHAGKDRTGIIITLFHLLTEATKEIILLDYLASEMDTKEHLIQILLDAVSEKGGIVEYLKSCQISNEQIALLKSKIVC